MDGGCGRTGEEEGGCGGGGQRAIIAVMIIGSTVYGLPSRLKVTGQKISFVSRYNIENSVFSTK